MNGRDECLDTARQLINGDRAATYGDLHETAAQVQALLNALPLTNTPADYPLQMILVKLARLAQNPGHLDSWVDIAGYAALGYELAPEPKTIDTLAMDDGLPTPPPKGKFTTTAADWSGRTGG